MLEVWKSVETALERVVLDPSNRSLLALVKGVRNGVVYGTKVRFPHALVIIFLFRSGTFRKKLGLVLSATRQHARNLGLFALIYKGCMVLLRNLNCSADHPTGKERSIDPFISGLVGGYFVFGRSGQSGVTQQIVIYIYARVLLAIAKVLVVPPTKTDAASALAMGGISGISSSSSPPLAEWRVKLANNAWPAFASLSWAAVMYLFKHYPDALQPSLRSSMQYIYADSDHWDSLRTFLWHNK